MKIYTKTGDTGHTGIYGGERRSKSDLRIQCIGEIDELNAAIGTVAVGAAEKFPEWNLQRVQSQLFNIGAELAMTELGKRPQIAFDADLIEELERSIDEQTASLEPLRNFILPGGTELSARLHMARTICRRAERSLVKLNESEPLRSVILVYINRLSDWLFVCSRTANASDGVEDVKWVPEG